METATVDAPAVAQSKFGLVSISVPLERIKAMIPLASTDVSRGVLNTLLFEVHKEQILIVATDGRQLGVSRITATNEATGVFWVTVAKLKELLQARRVVKDEVAELTFNQSANLITLSRAAGLTLGETQFLGPYPRWRTVLPDKGAVPTGEASFNPEFCSTLFAAANQTVSLRLYGRSEKGRNYPMEIIGRSFYGLLMPMRPEQTFTAEWIEA